MSADAALSWSAKHLAVDLQVSMWQKVAQQQHQHQRQPSPQAPGPLQPDPTISSQLAALEVGTVSLAVYAKAIRQDRSVHRSHSFFPCLLLYDAVKHHHLAKRWGDMPNIVGA